jgi:AraC family transcriptional regulator
MSKKVIKKFEIGGLTISENLYPPLFRQPGHTHELASLSFVLTGSYLERCGGQEQTRQRSNFVFRPPQERHAVDYHNEVRILSVEIDAPRLAYFRERATALALPLSCRTERITRLGQQIYKEFRWRDTASALSIEGLVLELIAEAARVSVAASGGKSPRWVTLVEEVLRSNFSKPFTLEDLAGIVGVHPVHLARSFRRQKGCTVGQFVRHLRVDFALRQLAETESPLSDIAAAAGFADHSHLTRTIKAHSGLTPSEYRKNFR